MPERAPVRVVTRKDAVREAVVAAHATGSRIALVPTMGALHAGHLSLVARARELADFVVMSIFVNPLQFGPTEDLDRYPRSLQRDEERARGAGVDLVFAPETSEMYPDGEPWVAVVPERGADRLCGASRPGHFRGVLTVVAKLFGIATPDVAVFGQKDYQQAVLIRRMVRDLEMPVRVELGATVREADGLAMSSRNAYLSASERQNALALSRALRRCAALHERGEENAARYRAELEAAGSRGVELEYAEVVDVETLAPVERVDRGAVCAIAARVGSTRLIDNLILGSWSDH